MSRSLSPIALVALNKEIKELFYPHTSLVGYSDWYFECVRHSFANIVFDFALDRSC
jgi:hypothetical protein